MRPDGTVKVLDFGLAKAMDRRRRSSARERDRSSPTITTPAMTQAGMILGTAAYMAPEQARGQGGRQARGHLGVRCLLFEMLTGTRAFDGEDVTDTLAAVVRAEPDWSLLPPGLPPTSSCYLRRCLQKDPKQRVRDMATMRLALEGAFDTAAPRRRPRRARRRSRCRCVGIGRHRRDPCGVALRSGIGPRPPARAGAPDHPASAGCGAHVVSSHHPDGRTVAYVAQQGAADPQLYLRDLNAVDARIVTGSSGARQPFFSPDGRWVAFFANGQLQKAEVGGGAPIRMADVAYPFGGTWTTDNTIIYAASLTSGLMQIPASGGTPRQISKPDGAANGYAHVFPQALPGGRSVLFTMWGQTEAPSRCLSSRVRGDGPAGDDLCISGVRPFVWHTRTAPRR